MTKLRIVFLGTPDASVATLQAVLDAGHTVPLAITRPDRRRGRGGVKGPSPVKRAALDRDVPILQPENVNEEEAVARILEAAPDVLLIVAFGQILRKPVLEASRLLPLNLHFSLLPEYRGAAPVARALADGRTVTGVTLQRVVRQRDAGPVLDAREVPIGPEETAPELMDRLSGIGAKLTVATLDRIAGGDLSETPQDHERATLAPMIKKEEGRVDWAWSAARIHDHVRAFDPWPGSATTLFASARGKPMQVSLVTVRRGPEEGGDRPPGEVLEATRDHLLVQTGAGLLAVLAAKPAGRKALSAAELKNGYRVAAGDRFGD